MLICPNCKEKLIKQNKTYNCINKHSFDISKNSYVNLLLPNKKKKLSSGDNLEMVQARKEFLEKGYYSNLLNEITKIIKSIEVKSIIDAGCGEGYFINNIKSIFPLLESYALDISKGAVSHAAKSKLDITYLVASSKNIPISDRSIDLILNIFAPHFDEEFKRILNTNGYLLKVTPGRMHLYELKELLYNDVYYNDEVINNLSSYTMNFDTKLTYKVNLESQTDLMNLLKMTPYYYTTNSSSLEVLTNHETTGITLDFVITLFKLLDK
jgi:23S rRNA (guanine745-N1)-methyltransferase